MDPGSYSIVTSALLQQRKLEIAANNLANVSTVGYKAEFPVIDTKNPPKDQNARFSGGDQGVSRSDWKSTHINFAEGAKRETGNSLDLALSGPGFFVVQAPDGLRYTRGGRFEMNEAGQLSTNEGWPVIGKGGAPIPIGSSVTVGGRISINTSGEVTVNGQNVGQIEVVNFADLKKLEKRGSVTFVSADPNDVPAPVAVPKVQQGVLEMSNTSPLHEMVGLIETARLYETYQRMLQSFDQSDDRAINDLGRVQQIS